MPKGIRKDGTPNKPPGRPKSDLVKKGPYWFPPDVIAILSKSENATAFIIDSIRKNK